MTAASPTARLETYLAAIFADWYGERAGAPVTLIARHADRALPVITATSGDQTLAVAIGLLWDAEADAAAEDARQMMEERLSAGNVRGPHLLWVPPRAAVPAGEPDASDFVMRVQMGCAPMLPGARNEVDLPAKVQLAKTRDEGGYASVIGGLSRYWTTVTERVSGTFNVNSMEIRRVSQDEARREAVFARIAELAGGLSTGDATEFETVESWTVQRLREEPLGETGFAIAQAPPALDPSEGTQMRRLLRKRLSDAGIALAGVQAQAKCVALAGIYEFAGHENIGSFVKSLNPSLFAALTALTAIVDGEVRPIFGRT